MNVIKALSVAGVVCLPAMAMADDPTQSDGWTFSLGAGAIYGPTYLGDDDSEVLAFPNIRVTYGERFSAAINGVRYDVLSTGLWSAGAVLAYDFGREEDSGDDGDLLGLGDIDGTVELGGYVEYDAQNFSARLELRQGVDGGHNGLYGEAEVEYNGSFDAFSKPVFFSVGPTVAFGDDAYNSTFFDVSAAQSAASGISQYDAGAGLISYGLHARAVMPLTERTALVGFMEYDQLTGDVGDSSIVQERGSETQTTVGLMLNYTF